MIVYQPGKHIINMLVIHDCCLQMMEGKAVRETIVHRELTEAHENVHCIDLPKTICTSIA